MTIRLLAFTDTGFALACRLAEELGGRASRCGENDSLAAWTAEGFSCADALVYVGAAGIAVRAAAPHLRSKASDPAVVVVDEGGRWAVPILSGHLGGANALARRIAAVLGGQAVITTATDCRGIFPVDLWAKAQNCAVLEPERIKDVSSRLLAGETVEFECGWPVEGTPPPGLVPGEGSGFSVSVFRKQDSRLHLVPRIVSLGVGCRRGTGREQIEAAFAAAAAAFSFCPESVVRVCTIRRKGDEPGLLAFCAARGWPLCTYSAEELAEAPGDFSGSAFVEQTVGVDNVCERAAVLGSGGTLLIPKQAGGGVTLAAAAAPYCPDWRWEDV